MSFSVELWDQFEEVYSKVTRGKDFSEKVVEFVRKRQLIEKEYAKKLQALTKSSEIEMGTLNDAWTQIKEETESIAKKHAELSESFGFQVADPVANHVREAKKRRQAGRKLIKDLAAAEQRAVAAKSSYESARRGQDDAKEKYDQACANNTVSPQNEKLMKKVKEAGKKAEKADQQYRAAVDACKATQDKYYDEEMPRVLAEFESCEKARIDCTKDALVNWVKLQESLAPEVQSACDRMHKSVNAIGAEADLRQFVNEKATHREKPPRCEYETYNQELQKCVGGGSSSSNSGRSVSSSRSSVPSSSRSAPSGAAHSQSSGSSSHAGQKKFHTLGQCRALHTYTATDPHELSFQVGDVIDILKKDASGWWQGALNGVVGVFPSVEWVEELAPGGAIGNVRALYDYTAETEFELTIRAGEVLHAEKEEEGWYCGTNSDNQYGRFPANYVERV